MHESDFPPAPPRFRRRVCCQLVMAHNNGVGDVSTIQTTPPFELYLAAHVQKVHKMIAGHTALTTLASHRLFLLILYPLSLASQVLSSFSSNHVLHWGSRDCFPEDAPFILDDLRHSHRRDQRYAAPLPPLHNESNMPTSCPSTPPTAVCRTIPCRNLAIAYPTKLLPCSITLPIDVLASPSM